MKKLITGAAALVAVMTASACKMPAKYECTIKDAKTGEVIKKYKVQYKSQCIAL
jgi:hypothetical protein